MLSILAFFTVGCAKLGIEQEECWVRLELDGIVTDEETVLQEVMTQNDTRQPTIFMLLFKGQEWSPTEMPSSMSESFAQQPSAAGPSEMLIQ